MLMVVTGFIVTIWPLFANATETGTMICHGGIVSIGDTAGEVIGKCGSPATSSKREDKKIKNESQNSRVKEILTVSIDDWIFNFGPNEFQYQVVLENGKLQGLKA